MTIQLIISPNSIRQLVSSKEEKLAQDLFKIADTVEANKKAGAYNKPEVVRNTNRIQRLIMILKMPRKQ